MAWFPGLRRCSAYQQLRVTGDARQVMKWLADPDRRERDWWRLVGERADIRQPGVTRLANGGLRFDQVVTRGDLLLRATVEDVAIHEHQIDRIHRSQLNGRAIPFRWVMNERITVQSVAEETDITVHLQGRWAGTFRLLRLFVFHDTAAARWLQAEVSRAADLRVAGIAASFTGPPR